jgi:hypothetical protein
MYFKSLIKQGSKRDLSETDMWLLEDDSLSKILEERLNQYWQKSSSEYFKHIIFLVLKLV